MTSHRSRIRASSTCLPSTEFRLQELTSVGTAPDPLALSSSFRTRTTGVESTAYISKLYATRHPVLFNPARRPQAHLLLRSLKHQAPHSEPLKRGNPRASNLRKEISRFDQRYQVSPRRGECRRHPHRERDCEPRTAPSRRWVMASFVSHLPSTCFSA